MPRCALLAVNDPNILYLLRRYVEESGLQAVAAGRDGDLVEAAARTGAALVILEAGDAGGAGEALQALRRRAETRRTPVLIYSRQEPDSTGPDPVTAYLQECLLYDQFLEALRRVGVKAPLAPGAQARRAQEAVI